MLTHKPSQEEINGWKHVYDLYKNRLKPNRISGEALYGYLESRYPLLPLNDGRADAVVIQNILENEVFARELPPDTAPNPVCCVIEPVGAGKVLYSSQDDFYHHCEILVGIDLVSGYFLVEGSSQLWDELYAHRGLNKIDLSNFYSVAEYIACLERFGMLEQTLAE